MYNNVKTYKRVYAKKQIYRGIEFDSKMEADFAMFLDGRIIEYKKTKLYHKPVRWIREPEPFVLIEQENWVDKTEKDESVKTIQRNKKHTLQRVIYTPDFYLPDYDLYIETKGFQFDDELFHLRLRMFKHKYPDKAIWVIRSHDDFMKLDKVLSNINISKTQNI